MKLILKIIALLAPLFIHGQMEIEGRVIPWKEITETNFSIILKIDSDTLINMVYSSENIGKPGQYPELLFKLDSVKNTGTLYCEIRYGSNKPESLYWASSKNICKLRAREKRIEIEFHFQEYEDGLEFLSKFTIKKIFEDNNNLKIIPIWDIRKNSIPKYAVINNTSYKLFGQSGDGYFDGILYSKNTSNNIKRVYTGCYNLNEKPHDPLFKNSQVISQIRDYRSPDNLFHLEESGEFVYKVLLGFKDYEGGSTYGSIPFFSVENDIKYERTQTSIKEYYELVHIFKIE